MKDNERNEEKRKRNPKEKKKEVTTRLYPWERGPTAPGLERDEQVPLDPLEEESMESFPASDAPSHSRSTP